MEGTESIYFWSPSMQWDTARVVTPQLPDDFYDEQKPLSGRAHEDPKTVDMIFMI